MLIDTHCHLNFHAFKNDIADVIKRAKEEGVEKIIIPGAKLDSSEKGIDVANKYDNCFAAVGVHPHHVEEVSRYQGIKVLRKEIEQLAKSKKVVAIGEIGLDYHEYEKTVYEKYQVTTQMKSQQKDLLKMQIELALKFELPVIFHCRDAFIDMVPVITEYASSKLRGVFHCFGGNTENLRQVVALGYYVGFDGNITYKNAQNLRDLVKETPFERILMETDAPFLAPEPHRGERNEPKNVRIIAEMIAQIKNINLEELAESTTKNAQLLFNI